jgi:hypothetical protein
MTKMNIIRMHTGILSLFLFLFLMLPSWLEGAENGHIEHIKQALETSSLPQTGQAAVSAKAAAAIHAGVPAEDVEIIVSRAVARGSDGGTINRLLDVSMSAKKENLPVAPLLNRIEQGLSKGVPAERIAIASERLAEKLSAALPIVDALIRDGMTPRRDNERDAAIASAARALEKSVPAEAIDGMGAAVKDKRGSLPLFTSAVDTATYFAASGMSPKTAVHLVRNALEKGSSERELSAMVRRMDDEMKRGTSADDIAAKMERGNMQGERSMDREDMRQEMKTDREMGTGSGMGGRGMR